MINGRWASRVARAWVRINLLVSGVRIRGERQVALDPNDTFVFMANHQSHFDVLAVVAALPEFQLRWVAKKELTRSEERRVGKECRSRCAREQYKIDVRA